MRPHALGALQSHSLQRSLERLCSSARSLTHRLLLYLRAQDMWGHVTPGSCQRQVFGPRTGLSALGGPRKTTPRHRFAKSKRIIRDLSWNVNHLLRLSALPFSFYNYYSSVSLAIQCGCSPRMLHWAHSAYTPRTTAFISGGRTEKVERTEKMAQGQRDPEVREMMIFILLPLIEDKQNIHEVH